MKKADMIVRDEDGGVYDLSKAVRGRHAHLVGCGSARLVAELHPVFFEEGGPSVNGALRQWVAEHHPPAVGPAAEFDCGPASLYSRNGTTRGFWFAKDLVPYFPTEESVNAALREWVAEHHRPKRRPRART